MTSLPGRRDELAWIRERIEGGSAALISGEAGVGKTRLVREATRARNLIAWIAFPGARFAVPGLGLRKLVGLGGARAERLARTLDAPGDEGSQLLAICEAADGLLRDRAPGVVVLDDVQWADDLTLSWLSRAGELLDGSLIALVVVARTTVGLPVRLADALASLRRAGVLMELTLAPLDVRGVEEMARSLGTRPTNDLAELLHRRSDGLPLVVEEMLRMRRDGRAVHAAAVDATPVGVPPVVAAIVRETVQEMSPAAKTLLSAAALAPQPASEKLLRDATGLPVTDFDVALEAVLGSGLVSSGARSGVLFRHDLQREAVQASIAHAERRKLHRAIATALQRTADGSAAQIAQQLIEAGEEEAAIGWLERAADEAITTHDPGSALSYLMAAVRLGARGEALSRAVDKATVAARGANRQEDGVRLIETALEGKVEPRLRGRLLLAESRLVLDRGDFERRIQTLQDARQAFVEAKDDAGHAAALGSLTLPVDGLLPIRERIELGGQGLALAERSGDPMAIARCAGNLAAAEMSEGHHRRAFALWRRAMEAADPKISTEAADEYLRNAGNKALAGVAFGQYGQAEQVIREGVRVAADRHPRWEGKLRTTEALLLWRTGRWDQALERAAHGHPVPETYTALVQAIGVLVDFERSGRLDLASLELAADTLIRHSDYAWAAVVQSLLTRVRGLRREPLPARGIPPLVDQLVAAGMRTGWEDLLPAAAEADPVTYRRLLATFGGLRPTGLRVEAAQSMAEGLVAEEDGDRLMERAAEAFESLGEPYAAAHAFARASLIRIRRGDRGSDLALRAATLYEELGARRSLASFLRRAPRARALEPFRRSARRMADRPWSLTRRESEVADLARRGYTAAQIGEQLGMARRTAEKHLEAVKLKLGAAHKSELVRLLSEQPSHSAPARAEASAPSR